MMSAVVDLPMPAGPVKSRCGRFFLSTNALILSTMCCCPIISGNVLGRYFSDQRSVSSGMTVADGRGYKKVE